MAKFFFYTLTFVVLAIATSEAIQSSRVRSSRLRLPQRPIFSRQELAPPAPTPYPSAADLKPAVPFVEENAAEPELVYGPPEQTYGPPDLTYGPPEAEPTTPEALPENDQLPFADEPEEFAPNPDAEEFEPIQSSRLVNPRRPILKIKKPARLQARRPQQKPRKALPARLIAPQVVATVPAAIRGFQRQQYIVIGHPLGQIQSW